MSSALDISALLPQLLSGGIVMAQLLGQTEKDLRYQIDEVIRASEPDRAAQANKALFTGIAPEHMQMLKENTHHGVAFRAAWEEIRLGLPKEKLRTAVHLDSTRLHRFLGYLEGRLHVALPQWWEKILLEARAYDRNNVFFRPPDIPPYARISREHYGPRGLSIEKKNNVVVLKIDRSEIVISEVLARARMEGKAECISAALDEQRCYLALHLSRCTPYLLACIEKESGKLIWIVSVWAGGGLSNYSGLGFHWVTIQPKADRVRAIASKSTLPVFPGQKALPRRWRERPTP